MSSSELNKCNKIVIGTGNILIKDDFKKATNPSSELLICLKAAIEESNSSPHTKINDNELTSIESDILRNENADCDKTTKIVAKLFINDYSDTAIEDALSCLATTFNNRIINTLILAYHPKVNQSKDKFVWAENDLTSKENFMKFWKQLQIYLVEGKIRQLGISDMNLEMIVDIFNEGVYDFEILQINLATCCVVPKDLQNFCKERDIQLLTHSDPQVMINEESFQELGLTQFKCDWAVKYQIHYIDRGILAFKGYIVSLTKQ